MAASGSQFSEYLGIGMFVPLVLSFFKLFGLRSMKLQQRLARAAPSMRRQQRTVGQIMKKCRKLFYTRKYGCFWQLVFLTFGYRNVCPFCAFFLQAIQTLIDEPTAMFVARQAKHALAIAHIQLNIKNEPNIVEISYYDQPWWFILATNCFLWPMFHM